MINGGVEITKRKLRVTVTFFSCVAWGATAFGMGQACHAQSARHFLNDPQITSTTEAGIDSTAAIELNAATTETGIKRPVEMPIELTVGDKIDVASVLPLLPDSLLAGVVVYPQTFLTSDPVRVLPTEVIASDLKQHFGLDFRDLSYALVFLDEDTAGSASAGLIAHSHQPVDWRGFPEQMIARTDYGILFGRPYRRGRGGLDQSILVVADSTLIIAPDATIRRMLAKPNAEPRNGTVAARLASGLGKELDLHLVTDFTRFRRQLARYPEVGAQRSGWAAMTQIAASAEQFELRARVSSQFAVGVVFETASAAAANALKSDFTALTAASSTRPSGEAVNVEGLVNDYLGRALLAILAQSKTQVRGSRFQIGMRGEASTQVATCASVAMLLEPMIDAGYQSVRWLQTVASLGRLSQAMSEYVAEHGYFPTYASFSDSGQPLLSWRVHLLPYLGYDHLYKQFKLNEAWDSAANKPLIAMMPTVYQNPLRPRDFMTSFFVPVGKGTMFEPTRRTSGVRETEVIDGLANTLTVVEAEDGVATIWTKPSDLAYRRQDPWRGLGRESRNGFLAALASGTVRHFPATITERSLHEAFSRAGHESDLR